MTSSSGGASGVCNTSPDSVIIADKWQRVDEGFKEGIRRIPHFNRC